MPFTLDSGLEAINLVLIENPPPRGLALIIQEGAV